MWDGQIDARHLYSALRLTVRTYERDGSTSKTAGLGTGFAIRGDLLGTSHKGYLVTNRHVLDPNFREMTGRQVDQVTVEGHRQGSSPLGEPDDMRFTIKQPEVHFPDRNPDGSWADVALIDLDTAEVSEGSADVTRLPTPRLAGFRNFPRLSVGAQVLIPGYPGIDQVVAHRPILVSGTVASDPRFDAEIGAEKFIESVLCHSFSWAGMSGSPVFAMLPKQVRTWGDVESGNSRELYLVGVNAGHITIGGSAEGALTYFVKSTVLIALLRKAGAQGLGLEMPEPDYERSALEYEEVELGDGE